MANKFPLIADGSAIKELPSGDNLDLTGSGISISGGQGTSGQVLQSNEIDLHFLKFYIYLF